MPSEPETRRLELDGGDVVYHVRGSGPPIVLGHALGPLAWGDVSDLARTCTVVVLDWDASTLDLETAVTFAWFEPLVRALGQEQAALCVWSMSGPGGIWFAAEEPASLSRLVLVDVAGLSDEGPDLRWRDLWHLLAMRIVGRPTRGFVRMLWRGWVWSKDVDTRPLEDATLRFFSENPNAYGLPGSEDDEDEDDDEPLIDELPTIAVPTLVLAGRHSSVLGPGPGRAAANRLRDGELVVFEESGHSLQLEEPDRFQRVVAEFVANSDATASHDQ